jgi:hypothetical protein
MFELPQHTEKKNESVYICPKKVGKAKMPCDGWAPALSAHDESA